MHGEFWDGLESNLVLRRRVKTVLFWLWAAIFFSGLVTTLIFLGEHGLEKSVALFRIFLGKNLLVTLVFLFGLYLFRAIVFIPVSILGAFTGIVLSGNEFGAVLFACFATTLSAFISFGVARLLGRSWVAEHESPRLKHFEEKVKERGFFTIFILRLAVFIPFDFINLSSGLSAIRFRDFALATILGVIPEVALQVFVGTSVMDIFSTSLWRPGTLLILALILLGVGAIGYFLKTHPHFRGLFSQTSERQKTKTKSAVLFSRTAKTVIKFTLLFFNMLR